MKRGVIGIFLCLVLISSAGVVSAGWFSDFWDKITGGITGHTIEEACDDSVDNDEDGSIDCSDGDCDSSPICHPCYDSDGGIDYSTKGYGTGIYGGAIPTYHTICEDLGGGQVSCQGFYERGPSTYIDDCVNANQLNEPFCGADGKLHVTSTNCQYGCIDELAVCYCGKSETQTCEYGCDLENNVCNSAPEEQCDSTHLSLCTDEAGCTGAGGYWYNSICNSEPQQSECSSANLRACTDRESCLGAGGYWYYLSGASAITCNEHQMCSYRYQSSCRDAYNCTQWGLGHWYNNYCNAEPDPDTVCDSNDITACVNLLDCTNAGGYWYNERCNPTDGNLCDSDHLSSCAGEVNCTGAGGYWSSNAAYCYEEEPDEDEEEIEDEDGQDEQNETEQDEDEEEIEDENGQEKTEAIILENGTITCEQGCLFGEACFPVGVRKKVDGEHSYCNSDAGYVWEAQVDEDSACENSHECRSNLCVDDVCVKQGLFMRILNWFRKLFGD